METATQLLKIIEKKQAQRETLLLQLGQGQSEEKKFRKCHEAALEARAIVQKVAKDTQSRLEFKFSSIVSTALAGILDEPYEFSTTFVERRNTVECDFALVKDGVSYGITDSVGGGVVDIVSFALRIAYWSLKKTHPVFILDEPFKFLSNTYHEKASEMMKLLSEKLGIQFIMVSHLEKMVGKADKVFTVTKGVVDVKAVTV